MTDRRILAETFSPNQMPATGSAEFGGMGGGTKVDRRALRAQPDRVHTDPRSGNSKRRDRPLAGSRSVEEIMLNRSVTTVRRIGSQLPRDRHALRPLNEVKSQFQNVRSKMSSSAPLQRPHRPLSGLTPSEMNSRPLTGTEGPLSHFREKQGGLGGTAPADSDADAAGARQRALLKESGNGALSLGMSLGPKGDVLGGVGIGVFGPALTTLISDQEGRKVKSAGGGGGEQHAADKIRLAAQLEEQLEAMLAQLAAVEAEAALEEKTGKPAMKPPLARGSSAAAFTAATAFAAAAASSAMPPTPPAPPTPGPVCHVRFWRADDSEDDGRMTSKYGKLEDDTEDDCRMTAASRGPG